MNEVIRTIRNRRSIRAYKPEPLKRAEIEAIVEAGVYAPSGHNTQPWHFTVIQDRGIIDHVNARAKEKMAGVDVDWIKRIAQNPNADITHKAPVLIIISARQGAITGNTDCVAAMQNMMLAAASMDIGSCWMGLAGFLFDDEAMMRSLGVPEGYRAVQAAVFGYPADGAKKDAPARNLDVVNYMDRLE